MTEAEWLTATDPKPMLTSLPSRASKRKVRLFAVACSRKIWASLREDAQRVTTQRWQKRVREWFVEGQLDDPCLVLEAAERAAEVSENFADGLVRESEFRAAYDIAVQGYYAADQILDLIINERLPRSGINRTEREIFAAILTCAVTASRLQRANLRNNLDYGANTPSDLETQSNLLRDIFGNPYRKVKLTRKWLTSTVVLLARQMYETRDFSPMPILADALQDAGCDNEDILNHCRQPGEHVRGCWVVDLLTGRKPRPQGVALG